MDTKDTVREGKNKKNPAQSTQIHMRVAEIRDNTVVLKNGGVRSILRVTPINFNLKSEQEQNALIVGYQGFLNTLEFPIQILVRSRKLDVDQYVDRMKGIAAKQTNPLLQKETFEYTDFVSRLVEYADIMEKDFLVIVPYNPPRAEQRGFFDSILSIFQGKETYSEVKHRHEEFEQLKKGLSQRTSVIQNGLENVGLKVSELQTQELIELFYGAYNPISARNQKITKLDEMAIQTEEEKN